MAGAKVSINGTTIMDISDTTATAEDVGGNKVFYNAAGVRTVGTGSGYVLKSGDTMTGTLTNQVNWSSMTPAVHSYDVMRVRDSLNGSLSIFRASLDESGVVSTDIGTIWGQMNSGGTETLNTYYNMVKFKIASNGTRSIELSDAAAWRTALGLGTAATAASTSFAAASHNHAAGDINSGTLGVARGGTGASTFTSGEALIGNGTSAITTRSILNNTSTTYVGTGTDLITKNTLAYWNGAYNSSGTSNIANVGTITSGTWTSTIGVDAKTSSTSGWKLDTYGNFLHQRSNTSDSWNIMASDGTTPKFKVVYDSGDTTIAGKLTVGSQGATIGGNTSLGTVTAGTWNGTAIAAAYIGAHTNATASNVGQATASVFGHVKLSDNYTSSAGAASAGIAASSKAVYDAYTGSLKVDVSGSFSATAANITLPGLNTTWLVVTGHNSTASLNTIWIVRVAGSGATSNVFPLKASAEGGSAISGYTMCGTVGMKVVTGSAGATLTGITGGGGVNVRCIKIL